MAVFVAASDESAGKDRDDQFVLSGLIARERDWSDIFAPAWQRLVLDGPPQIPYLHMVDMRSKRWREEQGLSEDDANKRTDAAVEIVARAEFLFPIGLHVSGAEIGRAFSSVQIRRSQNKSTGFAPDYLCFLGYSMLALEYVSLVHKDCDKLDFMVEKNGKITDYIRGFHSTLKRSFTQLGRPELARLVGDLIPVGKDRLPVQAADLLCWHTARSRNPSSMSYDDLKRYTSLSQKQGSLAELEQETINELAATLLGKDAE